MWDSIKEELIEPFLDLKMLPFDLHVQNRDRTDDEVTKQAAEAIKVHKVGIKCATVTPQPDDVKTYNLKRMYPSPNGTIRNLIGGTIFRAPITMNLSTYVRKWNTPIIIARHAFGDQYKATSFSVPPNSVLKMIVETTDPKTSALTSVSYHVNTFGKSGGVGLGMFNEEASIREFARSCIEYALKHRLPLVFTTKNTILKGYDEPFREFFAQEAKKKEKELKALEDELHEKGIDEPAYAHRLIDDQAAQALKKKGGFVWACKNYDGDVFSDVVAQGFGSLGLMTSVLVGPHDVIESEAAHGTVRKHFVKYSRGERTSTNSIASIYAWSQGLAHRAKLDWNDRLAKWSKAVEQCCCESVAENMCTADLAECKGLKENMETIEFIRNIRSRLTDKMNAMEAKH